MKPALHPSTPTLILSRADIAALMTPADYLEAMEAGFRALADGKVTSPPPLHIPLIEGGLHGKGARLDGERPVVAVKVNVNVPSNPVRRNLPTIQGAVLLMDAVDGRLLAILDSIEITLRRTAAATALAARYLARHDTTKLAICGCGAQARPQLEALCAVAPIREVRVWDAAFERAERFATDAAPVGVSVRAFADLEEAVQGVDAIVTCTTAREPFLHSRHLRPGQFIAAVGADSPEKSEIAASAMARAKVVADVLDQCVVMGDLFHALSASVMGVSDVHAELAQLVTGARAGRTHADEIFLFDSTGTGVQDVAAAAAIYDRAVRGQIGAHVQLG